MKTRIQFSFNKTFLLSTNPMIFPNVHNKCWSEWACWIHWSASVLNLIVFLKKRNLSIIILFHKIKHSSRTAAKCPAVIDNPMANGAEPLMSERRSSQTPCTTNTNINVINASMITAWIGSRAGFNVVLPKLLPKMMSGVAN